MVLFLWKDVVSLCLAIPEDAWCHLVCLIITLPALLHNTALSLLHHLKCLAGLFSETIMKLCAKMMQTLPPPACLHPCVQEPEKDSSTCTTAAQSTRKHTEHPLATWFYIDFSFVVKERKNTSRLFVSIKFYFVAVRKVHLFFFTEGFCTEQEASWYRSWWLTVSYWDAISYQIHH